MRGSRTFCQIGSKFEFIETVSIDEGREDQNTTISGPSSAGQRNAFRWRDDDGPLMNTDLVALCFFQGILTSIAKKPYIFRFFLGGGSRPPAPPPPPLDPYMTLAIITFNESRVITLEVVAEVYAP